MAGSDVTAKIVLLGETAVGKSSVAARFVRDEFAQNHESTIGAAFLSHTVQLSEGLVKLEIWDTAGQERYRSLAPMYYRNAVAALVVYDITAPDSVRRAREWMRELKRTSDSIIIALLGNKVDLGDEKRAVPKRDGEEIAAEENVLFFETSAQSGHNVKEAFHAVAKKILESGYAKQSRAQEPPGSTRVRAGGKKKQEPKSGCCKK